MSEADVVELVGYAKCYGQPDISCNDATANLASDCLQHHSSMDLPLSKKHAVSPMVADQTGTISLYSYTT